MIKILHILIKTNFAPKHLHGHNRKNITVLTSSNLHSKPSIHYGTLIVNISNITIVQTKKEELINASYMLSNFQNIFCHFFDYFVNHAQTFIFAWANKISYDGRNKNGVFKTNM